MKPSTHSISEPSGTSIGGVTYALHTLGWGNFQGLCGTILREVLGQTFQTFSESGDAGRDGAFYGKWKVIRREQLSGSFVFQCKFTAKSGAVLRFSDVSDEIAKARILAKKGLAKNYLLITNAALRGPVEEELRSRFLKIRGIESFTAFGGEWITQQIRENQRLRTLVPRLYGLGDLTEILDERVYEQAKEILSWLGDELEKFVVTDCHVRSVKALQEKGFVFLLGDAGSGKSTIAAALALAAADTWQCRVVKVRNATDFSKHWNPRDPNQFFWMDDTFGQRQYERDRALEWNHTLPHLSAAIRHGARVIFTSRTYIYKAAVEDLKESIFPLLKESRVVIEVEELTRREREQILYNHMRLGGQSQEFKTAVKEFLHDVAAHKSFLPETARRIGDPFFTKLVSPTLSGILHFVSNPEEYLREVIEGLGDANRAALGLTFMRGGTLRAGLDLSSDEGRAVKLMNSTVGEIRKSLQALEGSLIVRLVECGEYVYRFKHPTIRDAFGGVISDDPNLMDIYLRGTRVEQLFEEITCGDVGIEGVKLIVPLDRFGLVSKRLEDVATEPGGDKRIASFLTDRCSAEFCRQFLDSNATFLEGLRIGPNISWSEESSLFASLFNQGLLPEKHRRRFVDVAKLAAVNTPQWRFMLQKRFRSLFRADELREIRSSVCKEVSAEALNRDLMWWKSQWEDEDGEDPEGYFWGLENELDAFSYEFEGNKKIHARFESAREKLDALVSALKRGWEEKQGDLEAATEFDEIENNRSLFEDVDVEP